MEDPKPVQQQLHHFVLVHGAGHGAWCWFKSVELLKQAAHRATAIDLVSGGASTVSADEVKSFDVYNQPLHDVLESLAPNEKVILVGHSMGGKSLARASERYPHKIHAAVYVAGAMLVSGKSQTEPDEQEVFKELLKDAQLSFANGDDNPPTSCWPSMEAMKHAYYNRCSSEDMEFASKLLKPIPIMYDDATTFTKEGYYSVPRVYIRTAFDRCIAPRFQERFISQNPPTAVLHLESDHSPFLCAAKELHEHLLSVAATYAN